MRATRQSATLDPEWRRRVGAELRQARLERGMTQDAVGQPMTKAYVSAVEHGRTVPSLPALRLMTDRLGLTLATFFAAVESDCQSSGG